jgi:hypothetical protein
MFPKGQGVNGDSCYKEPNMMRSIIGRHIMVMDRQQALCAGCGLLVSV